MNGYDYSRQWFDFAFENSDKVTGNHAAVYLWNVELNNRLGWVSKFHSPASQAMMAAGIKSYNTYKKILSDLVQWGFIEMVQESKNQFTACIVALSNFDNAHNKALDKAMTLHMTKQVQSTVQRTCSIIKPINKETNKPINNNIVVPDESVFLQPVEDQEKKEKETAGPKSLNIPFEVFWKMYGKSADKKKCELKWSKLTDKQRQLAINDIPDYVASLSDRKFQKNPLTYLNGENWNDERNMAIPSQTSILNQDTQTTTGKIQQSIDSGLAALEMIKQRRLQSV